MQKKSILFYFTTFALLIFVLGEMISVAFICYGVHHYNHNTAMLGASFMYLWATNPIPLILSIVGIIKNKPNRKYYITYIVSSFIMWLIGGYLIAPYF